MPVASSTLPDFHPRTTLRDWGDGHSFRLADALTGVSVFGATGSGKTSGPAKHLAYGYLAAGFGGLVLCAKKEERRQWQRWAADCGRSDDLVIVNGAGNWRFNFLEWEADRSEEGGGLTINIVAILDEIASAVASSAGKSDDGQGDNKFWSDALHHLNTNLVELPIFADMRVSLPLLRSLINSAPQTAAQASDPKWKEESNCWKTLNEADEATRDAEPQVRADYEECRNYWLTEYPRLSDKTRSIITLTFTMLVRPLITRPLRKLFSSDTNIEPEDAFDGKIIIVDLPIQDYRLAGRIANLAWKFCFQVAVMRRSPPEEPDTYLRPVFLWADEAQNFITDFDAEYQAVARSAGGCTVYLTQNRESYRRVLGNNDAVDSLLGNLQAKFFCQNSGDTNEWAAKLLGERWMMVNSTNIGQSNNESVLLHDRQAHHNAGISRSEQRRYFVEPSAFTVLRRGGPLNDYQVQAIVYNGGYPEQYFDKALLADTTGNITTNQTGVLSEYGDFFPTEPGKIFLTTKPDGATGTTSSVPVYAIKLQLDANHDGTMDTSFAGPDNTSPDRPFVFWINNDCDFSENLNDPGSDIDPGQMGTNGLSRISDCTDNHIPSVRDLEDWARLWVCGVPALTNAGFQVTLSWNVISGSPAINIDNAVETNGGLGYLTNSTIAASQTAVQKDFFGNAISGAGMKIGTVSPGQPYTFPTSYFTNGQNKYLLFEGAGIGEGELVLTVSANGTNLASTSAFIDLHNIRDLYERAAITNSLGVISNRTSGVFSIESPLQVNQTTDTNIIIYVHGGANSEFSWLARSDTLYKRLYWAGYQGKVASVRWPSPPKSEILLDGTAWFNWSELIAYKSAPALKTYLTGLQSRFPTYQLNLFPQSLGGAVVSEAAKLGAPFGNMILCQNAMSASCYDVNAPTNATLLGDESGADITPDWQPMGYHGVYTNIGGNIISYYNTNDNFMTLWYVNQDNFKPVEDYSYNGTNCYFDGTTLMTDFQETRAMVARSRTLAIGNIGPASGQTTQGVVQTAIDLHAQFGIGSSAEEHSAFFTRPIQTIRPLFQQILRNFQIMPAP